MTKDKNVNYKTLAARRKDQQQPSDAGIRLSELDSIWPKILTVDDN